MTPEKKTKLKKGARLASYGVAGNIAGTLAGAAYGKNMKTSSRVGTAAGLAVGGWRGSRKSMPAQKKAVGNHNFNKRVGTKEQGRVGQRNSMYTPKVKKTSGGADAASY